MKVGFFLQKSGYFKIPVQWKYYNFNVQKKFKAFTKHRKPAPAIRAPYDRLQIWNELECTHLRDHGFEFHTKIWRKMSNDRTHNSAASVGVICFNQFWARHFFILVSRMLLLVSSAGYEWYDPIIMTGDTFQKKYHFTLLHLNQYKINYTYCISKFRFTNREPWCEPRQNCIPGHTRLSLVCHINKKLACTGTIEIQK